MSDNLGPHLDYGEAHKSRMRAKQKVTVTVLCTHTKYITSEDRRCNASVVRKAVIITFPGLYKAGSVFCLKTARGILIVVSVINTYCNNKHTDGIDLNKKHKDYTSDSPAFV